MLAGLHRRLISTGRTALVAAMLAAVAPAIRGDRLITRDGRILQVQKARELDDGGYRLTFEHGEIVCPAEFVASVEIEGDMSDYVPANEDERKKLEQGFVRYRGRWVSKPAYRAELAKEAEERRLRVEELSAHANFYDGWEKETKHFVIKTNTSPELLDYYGELLEAYYDLMDKRVGINPTPSLRRAKMRVHVYKSIDDFHNITNTPQDVAGFFSFQNEELHFFHDYQEPERSNWIALHECTHLLTYLVEPQSHPAGSGIWMNEGVADYFGSSAVTRDERGRIVIEPGRPQIDRFLTVQQAIRDNKHVPLERLFNLDQSRFNGFEYAHAWSFVYFLNNSGRKYADGFKKFFKSFYTIPKGVEYSWEPFPNKQGTAKTIPKQEVLRILKTKLGVKDLEKLESEWIQFMAELEVDAPRARLKRALSILQQNREEDYDMAAEDLDATIESDLGDPRAYWARGLLKSARGATGVQAGLDDFARAVALAPLDAGFRFNYAQCLAGYQINAGSITIQVSGKYKLYGSDDELAEAWRQFGLAVEMAPENDLYRESFERFREAYEAKFPPAEQEGSAR